MQKNKYEFCFAVLAAVCILLLSSKVGAINDPPLTKQITETIAKVRTGVPSTMARTDAAEHLADLTRKIDPKDVDDKTLEDIVSLLDTPDDSVRAWVAASLGNLGPRAKTAIPALLKALDEISCIPGDLTSEPFIRSALTRIGLKNLPPQCKNSDMKWPVAPPLPR